MYRARLFRHEINYEASSVYVHHIIPIAGHKSCNRTPVLIEAVRQLVLLKQYTIESTGRQLRQNSMHAQKRYLVLGGKAFKLIILSSKTALLATLHLHCHISCISHDIPFMKCRDLGLVTFIP